ncbi:helix-turn-helix domain-containing protein [Rugamonas aquatica]|uniref:DnaD N-terminal domain-containing protein n=1 Tax=Rugamonas aquatica TaxID=2743357 RepID=A0A6A7NBJ6_9BURK|nr:helix-turn-helix domain-containing protein [Rugamonas aquatica]MQA42152.1 hypothetical protein [Rugamonas aquatica]
MSAQIKPAATEAKKELTKKWGEDIMALGFTAVPDILLKRMGKLNLSSTEFVVMLQVLSFWWFAENKPFPSKKKIANAIGCSEKTVQKTMGRLEKLGFISRIERRKDADRNDSNLYDFSPLIAQLQPMAVEELQIQKAEREAKEDRMVPAWKKKNNKLKIVAG